VLYSIRRLEETFKVSTYCRLEALYIRARFEFTGKESSNLIGANSEYGSEQVSLKQRPKL